MNAVVNKNILRTLMLFVFLFSAMSPTSIAFGDTIETREYHSKAIIQDLRTNEKINIPVTISEKRWKNLTTFDIYIPTAILASKSHTHWDTTAGVSLTITQIYQEHWVGGRSVSLSSSSAKWSKTDNTISITNAKVISAVYGYPEKGGGLLNKVETRTIGTPTLNYWYFQYPSWSGTYVTINDLSYQASRAESLLVRGGSSWSLAFCVAQGGSAVIDCE